MNELHTMSDAEIDRRIREGLPDAALGPVFHGKRYRVPSPLPPDVEQAEDDLGGARGIVNAALLLLAAGLGATVAVLAVLALHLHR